ncbi:PRMT5 isoform 9 [Pan troglodytes]|uniref:Protein arginine methyltransferase 5 n=2 Tax=Homininae TaxID=207598 RepID=G3V3A3_HUMAN|nr:protein arginine methyltransferase 5 [Homo sapiens]KAI4060029.1 protein arginine methyltransferase 5 [Homo sapiens]PNI96542.1 PRMT5 isoform 9 [Pan troglodytes]
MRGPNSGTEKGRLVIPEKQGLEYANCGKAFSMDSSRLKSGEDSQELRGGHVTGAEFWCIFGSSSFPAAP